VPTNKELFTPDNVIDLLCGVLHTPPRQTISSLSSAWGDCRLPNTNGMQNARRKYLQIGISRLFEELAVSFKVFITWFNLITSLRTFAVGLMTGQ
jgi:hypothetical protein